MAVFGVSMPNDIQRRVDTLAKKWRTDRSKALVRIILEWDEAQVQQLPLAGITNNELTEEEQPAAQMKRADVQALVEA